MAAFTYSYSNSLGETLSTAGGQINRVSIYKPHTVNYISSNNSENIVRYIFSSISNDTVSTVVNKTFNKTENFKQLTPGIVLNQYDNYSVSDYNSSYLFTFIKENSETEYFTISKNGAGTYSESSTYNNMLPRIISSLDISFNNRKYYPLSSNNYISDIDYVMANGYPASYTYHLSYTPVINNSRIVYNNEFSLISLDNNQYSAEHTESHTSALYTQLSLTASKSTQSSTSISTNLSIYHSISSTLYTYYNEYPVKNFTVTYKATNQKWVTSRVNSSHLKSSYRTNIREQCFNTDVLSGGANFIETTISTLLYDSDGYLQGYNIAGSISGITTSTYLFFGTSILDAYVSAPWNNVRVFDNNISSKSVIVYYNNSNNTKAVSYETSAIKTTVTDENGITESVNLTSFRYLPEVSYLSMNWMGTSYKTLGTNTQENITTYTYISTYAFSDAELYISVILESTVNGDCYEYYTTGTSYKYIEGVTTYDYSEYTESAIKTTYSTAETITTSIVDYNGSYNTETVYDSYYSSQDYTRTRLETIFSETIYSSSFSYNSVTYVSSKFGHGTDVSTMIDVSSSSLISFSAYNKNGYTLLDSSMYMDITSELKSDSVLETRLNIQVKTYATELVISNTTTSITFNYIDNDTVLMQLNEPVTFSGSFIVSDEYNSLSTTSSYYNTTDFGTTFRNSSMVSSTEIINLNNEYLTMDRVFNYNITSAWAYKDVIDIISTYNTILQTTFKISYDTRTNSNSYSYTNIATTTAYGTSDRFINLVGVSRISTYTVYNTNTVAYYNGSTMATITSMSIEDGPSTASSSSVINYTFITSIDDYTSSTDLASTESSSLANKQFMNSITQLVSSTMEQQNDTLVFKSEIATYSTFRLSTSFITSSTININYEATTYTDEYNPISYTTTSMAVTSSLTVDNSIESVTASSTVTQAVNYTPIYSTVNGVYITG